MKDRNFAQSDFAKRTLDIVTKLRITSPLPGEWESVFLGDGYELAEIREYQEGDDLQRIHWPSLAREDKLHIIDRVSLRGLRVVIVADFSSSMSLYQKSKIRTNAAGLLAFSSLHLRTPIGLIAFSDRVEKYFPPSSDPAQFNLMLEYLIANEESPAGKKTDFSCALNWLFAHLPAKNLVFFLSDFRDDANLVFSPRLKRASRIYDFIPVVVTDPYERSFPSITTGARINWQDVERGEAREVYLTPKNARIIREKNEAWFADLGRKFQEMGTDYLALDSDDLHDSFSEFSNFFRKRLERRR